LKGARVNDPAAAEQLHDCRNAYAAALDDLAAADERIVVVVNDSVGSSKLSGFRSKFPDRLINVGIAEQNMVGVAAGLANAGKIPFVSAASCFLTARALEQIKVDCAYTGANVKLCGMSPGVAYGELGPTHHSIEDIAWLRAIDGMTILVPSDPAETAAAVRAAADVEGPVFIRVSRMAVPQLEHPDTGFHIGKAEVLREGSDVAIIATGTMVHRALEAAEILARDGVAARVVNMATIAPIDENAIAAAATTGAVVTVEEHLVRGGLGGAVAEFLSTHCPAPLKILGFAGFQPTGSAPRLMDRAGLNAAGIARSARDLIGRRQEA
jgi:transketolase